MVYYFCDICDFETCNKTDYKRHITRKKHLLREKEVESSDFICKRCNYKFISQEQVDKHYKRNEVFIKMPHMKHRQCNDFVCSGCQYACMSSNELNKHQVNCFSSSKYHNPSSDQMEKRAKKLNKLKQLMVETGGKPASMDIEKIKEKIGFNTDDYDSDDYYHDYEFLDENDWTIKEPDSDNMFYERQLDFREKITYKGDTYTVDFVKNALNSAGECIGGFLEL